MRVQMLLVSALCVFGVLAAPAIKDAVPAPEDNEEGIKINLEKLKFIPKELLCTLCHRVVEKLQTDLHEDPVKFQAKMLKTCDNYPELEDQVKCRSAFQNKQKIEQLLEPEAPTKMCREKQLCRADEVPLPKENFPEQGPQPLPAGAEPIPDVEAREPDASPAEYH